MHIRLSLMPVHFCQTDVRTLRFAGTTKDTGLVVKVISVSKTIEANVQLSVLD